MSLPSRSHSALGLAAILLLIVAGPLAARGADLSFAVLRDGSQIGTHDISFRQEGEDLHVEVAIELEVKLAFITLFRYSHRNHEIWRKGRLVSLETRTDDDGTAYSVSGKAMGQGFVVEGAEGRLVVSADVIPTSYWHPDTLRRDRLLDTQRGRLAKVSIAREDSAPIDGTEVDRYRMSGDIAVDLWYDRAGEWHSLAFSARGSDISYARKQGAGYAEAVRSLQWADSR